MLVCNISHPAVCIDSRIVFWCFRSWTFVFVARVQFLFEND
jgi:hypothetical protein